jgi:DNA repair exonuclease SbcCD ATPase subunit
MKYVNFKCVKICNFLSIGKKPIEINFRTGLNIITGINRDKEDRRNGVGKSTIADAIHFAIFGETIRELSKEFIVNYINKKNTYVDLDFSINENNKIKNYRIVRKLKPTKCYLFVDDIDVTESTIPNTNKKIKLILNSSPEVFQNCVIMSVNSTLPFMAQKKVEKRKFIEGILNLEIFSDMLLRARSEYNEVQKKYEHITKDFDHASNIYKLLEEQKNKIITNIAEQKNKIKERVEIINKDIEKNKQKIKDINKDLYDKSKNKLQQIKIKLNEIQKQLDSNSTKITQHQTEIKFYNKQLISIGTDENVCPTCLHQITNHDRTHIKKEKNKIEKDINNCDQDIESINQQQKSILDLKNNNLLAEDQLNEYISNIKTVHNNNKLTITYINALTKDLKANKKELCEVQKKETNVEIQDLDFKIKTKIKEVSELEESSNNIYSDLEILEIVKYILSEEGVKSFIVKKILDVLNNRLLYYLQKMDANCICRFNEYFEEEIVNEKNQECSYFNFSGAERKSIDLAMLFTFMDMRRLQGDIAYNLVIFDELLDTSLDEKGVELILNIIKERVEQHKESIYIISHRKESVKAATGDVIVLEKKNSITNRVDLTNNLI